MRRAVLLLVSLIVLTACKSVGRQSAVSEASSTNPEQYPRPNDFVTDSAAVLRARSSLSEIYRTGNDGLTFLGLSGKSSEDTWLTLGVDSEQSKAALEIGMNADPRFFLGGSDWYYRFQDPQSSGAELSVRIVVDVIDMPDTSDEAVDGGGSGLPKSIDSSTQSNIQTAFTTSAGGQWEFITYVSCPREASNCRDSAMRRGYRQWSVGQCGVDAEGSPDAIARCFGWVE